MQVERAGGALILLLVFLLFVVAVATRLLLVVVGPLVGPTFDPIMVRLVETVPE